MKVSRKSGISLIILVITIIVITIITLVVAWDMRTGGLIDTSREAVNELDKIKIISAIKLEIREKKIQQEANGFYEFSDKDLEDILNKYGYYDKEEKVLRKDNKNGVVICGLSDIDIAKTDLTTVVLMHFEDFTDSSVYNWDVEKDSATLITPSKQGFEKAIRFNNIIEIYTQNTKLNNVWTIEWLQNTTTDSYDFDVIQKGYDEEDVSNGFYIGFSDSGLKMNLSNGKTITPILQNTNIYPNQNHWDHIAIVSDGSMIKVFVNGTLSYQQNGTCSIEGGNLPFIFGDSNLSGAFKDELRISRVARYVSNFTPSSVPF